MRSVLRVRLLTRAKLFGETGRPFEVALFHGSLQWPTCTQWERAFTTVSMIGLRIAALTLLLSLAAGCGGAGPYGFSRHYVALDAEEEHFESVTPATHEDVRRDADNYRENTLGWFGMVVAVDVDASGVGTITMTHRTLAPRNICEDATEASCRVTVSGRAGGRFVARVQLRPEDVAGQDRLWMGSLVKIYGTPTGDVDEHDGPLLETHFYRHWPRGTFVTTGARGNMRR